MAKTSKTKTSKAKTSKAKTSKAKTGKTKTSKAKTGKTRTGARASKAKAPAGRSNGNRPPAEAKLAELKRRLREINDLNAASSLLEWDHATYMPTGGAAARARQGAMLRTLAHERSLDPALGKLIDELARYADSLPQDSDDANLIRVARRDFAKATKVPAEYVTRASELGSTAYDTWTRARPANDFATMRPILEQILDLSREYADFFAPYQHVADPLIDDYDEGVTTASLRKLFAELKRELKPMVRAITEQAPVDDSCLHGVFDKTAQLDFGLSLAKQIGYDLARGRLDETHHPFCTKFSIGDVRITTRVYDNDISLALFATVHETGHALYEQGINSALEGTPLGTGTSAGVHESQSRLWENVVARSRGFWGHYYPLLQKAFPDQLGRVPLDTFYRAINKVAPSLIRGDADEVTYNLHVMLRFELELQLLEGRLAVKDLPEAWNEAMRADLGLVPPDDRDGCLQDVHWFTGRVGGAFQGYTIGNILSSQFYAAAVKAHPEIPREIGEGKLGTLHDWLRGQIYRHGRKYTPDEIVERAAGGPMSMQPYLAYLRAKYGEIYRLPAAEERYTGQVASR